MESESFRIAVIDGRRHTNAVIDHAEVNVACFPSKKGQSEL